MTELPERKDFGDYGQWPGRAVLDPTGRRLGEVREIYLDDATDQPEWVLVELADTGTRYVPLADATVEDDAIRVAHAADLVEAAPAMGQEKELSQDEERRLYSHYGLRTSEDASDSLLPDPEQPAAEQPPAEEPAAEEPAAERPAEAQTAAPALAATPPSDEEADRPRPEAVAPEPAAPAPEPALSAAAAAPASAPAAELPAPGETSEPEDRGPMVPPRPEPLAPPVRTPEPSGPLAALRRRPELAAGIAASAATAIFLLLRRRRS